MELRSLRSPNLSSIPRSGSILKPFIHGQIIKLLNTKKHPEAGNLKLLDCKVRASGTTRSSSETVALPKTVVSKDENLAFVAGATAGKDNAKVTVLSRELLKLGFNVRAGARSTQRAESLVKSVQQMTLDKGAIPAIGKLEIVVCDLERREQIGPALGNASIVLCCIGASEKEVLDVTGPYRIDYQASKNLIDAATIAKVNHFILLTSLGTNKVGFPAAILNLFWGVLIWKRKAEEALLASGIPYTIVRPGGMERPTDSYKETHNISLSKEDTLFGGQVSNLQVAELMAFMAKNRSLSYCKVVEVIAETTAPLTPMGELLAKIPSQRVDENPLKDPEDAAEIEPAVSSAEAPKPSTGKEPTQAKATATRPLSPYIALNPTSADSEASKASVTIAGAAEPKSATVRVQIAEPLSLYEDLKPPSSPSPTPSGPGERQSSNSTPTEVAPEFNTGNDAAKSEAAGDVVKDAPQASTFFHSPYHVYDDFKPPTSPSPSSPSISLPSTSSVNGAMSANSTAQSSTADIIEVKEHHTAPKPMTLSPFTIKIPLLGLGFSPPQTQNRRWIEPKTRPRASALPPFWHTSILTTGDAVSVIKHPFYYRDERFSREEHYEWFKDYSHFRHLIQQHIKPYYSLLELGCGNSQLCEELYKDGITQQTCIDISAVAVEKMQKKLVSKGYKDIKVLEADMLDLPFTNESFDVVVEKGTMDVLFVDSGDPWNPRPATVDKVMAMLQGVHRVLKPDGIFISITFGQPHFRRPLFEAPEFTWSVEWSTFGDTFHYFFYILRKGRRSLDSRKHTERIAIAPISLFQDELENEDYIFRMNIDEMDM
ncbi:hypothetical protein RJ639_045002 [Escallonia herrerae]|uniref:EEF1A lysine methyltransferase 4 n=1 Tax=Escallonia herrerae TaxID=1293975 RepID=A0AA89B1Z9_9ASTE|nr:hypothetical protein RJ639_045002 [Escallonia herrerae]